jgi:hypothetical protein
MLAPLLICVVITEKNMAVVQPSAATPAVLVYSPTLVHELEESSAIVTVTLAPVTSAVLSRAIQATNNFPTVILAVTATAQEVCADSPTDIVPLAVTAENATLIFSYVLAILSVAEKIIFFPTRNTSSSSV